MRRFAAARNMGERNMGVLPQRAHADERTPHAQAQNCLLSALARARDAEAASRAAALLKVHSAPDAVTFNTMLNGAASWPMGNEDRRRLTTQLVAGMAKAGAQPTTATLGALMSAYAASGDVEAAVDMWMDVIAGAHTYTHMFSAERPSLV